MTDTDPTTRRIAIPERTARAIEARLADTEYDSVGAYAAVALELLVCEVERRERGEQENGDQLDGDAVAERLESLGYL